VCVSLNGPPSRARGFACRILPAIAMVAALSTTPARAQTGPTSVFSPAASAGAVNTLLKPQVPPYEGAFASEILAGGAVNKFSVPQASTNLQTIRATLNWCTPDAANGARLDCAAGDNGIFLATKAPDNDGAVAGTNLGLYIPRTPGWWPPVAVAAITIAADTAAGPQTLFRGNLQVSALWLPLALTLLIVLIVYPGCPAAFWYLAQLRYLEQKKAAKPNGKPSEQIEHIEEPPSLWTAIDPVELTKNSYGRGSIAKLQFFVLSFIVFGLLLFHTLRIGLFANVSVNLLYLIGLSAYGAAAARLVFLANRRLSPENWVWLRRKGWLPADGDIAPHAKWRDLLVSAGSSEIDPYRFQLAIISLVTAVVLLKAGTTNLNAFHIPGEFLALFGISLTIFIVGQTIGRSGYRELDTAIGKARKHEDAFRELKAKAKPVAHPPPPTRPGQLLSGELDRISQSANGQAASTQDAEIERRAFKAAVAQAKEMFVALYGPQLGVPPLASMQVDRMEPEEHDQAGNGQDYTSDLVSLRNTYFSGGRQGIEEGQRGR
jgi:hypothetical protein